MVTNPSEMFADHGDPIPGLKFVELERIVVEGEEKALSLAANLVKRRVQFDVGPRSDDEWVFGLDTEALSVLSPGWLAQQKRA